MQFKAKLAQWGGNVSGVRAQQVFNNPWAEDPGCYFNQDEIKN